MKYRVTYNYTARVVVEVEAEDEKQAETDGLEQVDAMSIDAGLELCAVTVKPIKG